MWRIAVVPCSCTLSYSPVRHHDARRDRAGLSPVDSAARSTAQPINRSNLEPTLSAAGLTQLCRVTLDFSVRTPENSTHSDPKRSRSKCITTKDARIGVIGQKPPIISLNYDGAASPTTASLLSARRRLLTASVKALFGRLPWAPRWQAHRSRSRDTNSVP
jgi:hypothetical protein